jgi:hypothetical protein
MKKALIVTLIILNVIVFFPMAPPPASAADEIGQLSESSIQAYLEKKSLGDTGSCLVDKAVIEIKGISDIVPGHQAEVFYNYKYTLRCNRGTESKDGQGVLHAVRLRDGNWVDRESFAVIGK